LIQKHFSFLQTVSIDHCIIKRLNMLFSLPAVFSAFGAWVKTWAW